MEISVFLTELQRGRGVSQKTWAARSGLSRATLWRWRKGKAVPRIVELTDALDALSVTRAERKRAFLLHMRARSGRGSVRTAPLSGIPVIRGDAVRLFAGEPVAVGAQRPVARRGDTANGDAGLRRAPGGSRRAEHAPRLPAQPDPRRPPVAGRRNAVSPPPATNSPCRRTLSSLRRQTPRRLSPCPPPPPCRRTRA